MPLKDFIPFESKVAARLAIQKVKGVDPSFAHILTLNGPKAFIFLAADYGNLGDVAISYAQAEFLRKQLPGFHIVDLPISKTIEALHLVKKVIQNKDIITIVGGGNFGNRYHQIEHYRQLVIKTFSKNKIVAFPQTIEFSEDEAGKQALQTAQKVYQTHSNLILGARENRSFEEMKALFPKNTVTLSPDVVMSLDKREPAMERKGAVICMRADGEKKLTIEEETIILELVEKSHPNPKHYDTHIDRGNLSFEERNRELDAIWDCFRGAKLVVTDRLHGMIFCYITGTPCLVFQNSNHKILSSYTWISFSPRIKILTNPSQPEVSLAIEELKTSLLKPDGYQSLELEYSSIISHLKA